MNTYRAKFFCKCPNNGIRIEYTLRIKSDKVIDVEAILDTLSDLPPAFHEALADKLFSTFGGVQRLVAYHHGVAIKTIRK